MVVGGPDDPGAFKTPSLRGAASRAPYMHAGQVGTMDAVLQHYQSAPAAKIGYSELRPLSMSEAELRQIAAFLATLDPLTTEKD